MNTGVNSIAPLNMPLRFDSTVEKPVKFNRQLNRKFSEAIESTPRPRRGGREAREQKKRLYTSRLFHPQIELGRERGAGQRLAD